MKKLFLIFAIVIMSICSLFAQKITESKYEIGIFEGTIDKYPITMFLKLSSDSNIESSGYYYYNSVKTPIELIVKVNGRNIEAYNEKIDKKKEIFKGTIDNARNFKGKWTDVSGKTLDFNMSLSTNYITDAAMIIGIYYEENNLEGGNTSYWESVDGIMLNNKNNNPVIDKLNMIINGMNTPVNEESLTQNITKKITNARPKKQSGSYDEEEEYREGYGYYINKINYIDDKIIAIDKTDEVDLGGAHGTYTVYQDIYLLQDGKKIGTKTKDLFKNINDKSLLALLRIKLAQKSKSYLGDAENNAFDEPINKIDISEDFMITPKGVTLIYQVYDIAPYVFGVIEIEFTYKELKPFIKDSSALKYLFDK